MHPAQIFMVKVIYILLCHGPTAPITRLIDEILKSDTSGEIIVHYDKRDAAANYQNLKSRYAACRRCHFLGENARVNGEWGTFGLVQAVINIFEYIEQKKLDCSHCYLVSGSCFPIRPLEELKILLQSNPSTEFIESSGSDWIKGGITKDRYLYHHFLPKRKYPKLSRWSYLLQKKLFLKRKDAESYDVRFGSQWWCLSRKTISEIAKYISINRQLVRFFRTVWIPDECFFQTLVHRLCDPDSISNRSLTYYEFDQKGRPRYFSDHEITPDIRREHFFVRKYQ